MTMPVVRALVWAAALPAAVHFSHLDAEDCCAAAFNGGFSSDVVLSHTPFDSILGDTSDDCSADGGEISTAAIAGRTGTTEVYVNVISQTEVGTNGWSLSIEVTGQADIVDITVDGTSGEDSRFCSAFVITGLARPEQNNGRRGAVLASVPFFECFQTLYPVGTESIARLTVTAAHPQNDARQVGRLFLANGLASHSQPFENILTVEGKSRHLCNEATAAVEVSFHRDPTPPLVRGDSNLDGRLDIADAVWTLSELFVGGPRTRCEDAADANNDGRVDIADPLGVIEYFFFPRGVSLGLGDGCVRDTDGDALGCELAGVGCAD